MLKNVLIILSMNYKKYIKIDKKLFRPSKTRNLLADTKKARKDIKFKIKTDLNSLIKIMMDNEMKKILMNNKISIILSTYNEYQTVEKTISEIFKKLENVEIIVVDETFKRWDIRKIKVIIIKDENLKVFSR